MLQGNNLPLLKKIAAESVALIYIDPPFNTGKTQSRIRIKTAAVSAGKNAAAGDRNGFGGRRYATTVIGRSGYEDSFADYPGFLRPRLQEAHRILAPNGSLFFHIDWRESARCRLLLEEIFGGPEHCINEIIWAYDFGARAKNKWPTKHDNIYWFAKDPANYIFHYEKVDRIPYMAPDLVGPDKAALGKTLTDTWWQTIVPTNGSEKTNYPTQKPVRILDRIVRVHSNPGDTVLDFFAGSGTTGAAALRNDRKFLLIDKSRDAVTIMRQRMAGIASAKRNEEKMVSKKYTQLVQIAQQLEQQQQTKKTQRVWENSPFAWMVDIKPAAKGKMGKEMVKKLLFDHGLPVASGTGTGADFFVDQHRVRVKFSTLWEGDSYAFQQIRNENFDILFCFGISPTNAHAWVCKKSDIDWSAIARQHGKKTRWIRWAPRSCPYAWLRPQNGDLSRACSELKKLVKKR
ncbi:MAG: site-specific DNA-methyltransferase [Gammaproteobacteria bacterium]|nr:site-specific DNA-methyltransferase [Gammaproteobacteria bacterium]MDA8031396.1 site-specific DNA-methyltransferase [Alphaproteobacteria bacterium]